MKFNDIFPNVYCINLEHRTDRWNDVTEEFRKADIKAERFDAIHIPDNGRLGLIKTYSKLFKQAIIEKYTELVVFEDDVQFEYSPNEIINQLVLQIPNNFDIIYLSGTLMRETMPFKENLSVINRCYGLFAVIYSSKVFAEIQKHYQETNNCKNENDSIDVWIADNIQPRKNCYIAKPFMVTQKKSYSDIENGERNYRIIKILYDKFIK
jgi:GR25 family glycosyltransferase involved in LPS biosynthesis